MGGVFFSLAKASPCKLLKQGGSQSTADSSSCTVWLSCRMAGNRIKKKSKWATFPRGARNTVPAFRQTQQTQALIGGCFGTKGNWYLKKKISWKPTQQMVFSWAPGGVGVGAGKGCWDNTTATRIQMTEKWQRWAMRADLSPQNFTKGNYTMWRVSGPGGWPFPTGSCCQSQPRWGFYQQQSEARQTSYWRKQWRSLLGDYR